jgi:hypothetical protein
MKMSQIRRKGRSGQVMIEFVLTATLSVPLILGLIAIGIRFVRELSISQVSRDLANMYSKGVDFTVNNANAAQIVQRLGPDFDFSATGNAVAILSEVRKITALDCSGTTPATTPCNTDQSVFEQRLVLGNSSVRASSFGTPSSSLLDGSGKTTFTNQMKKPELVAQGFSTYLNLQGTAPPFLGADGLTMITLAPEHAFMVEVIVNTTDLNIPGFMPQTQAYSRNIF